MSDASNQKSAEFFQHLLNIGVVNEEQFDAMNKKCNAKEENKMLFQVSNYFTNFTASDWFDLSARVYSNWQKPQTGETLSTLGQQLSIPTRSSMEAGRFPKANNNNHWPTQESSRTGEKRQLVENGKKSERQWESAQKQHKGEKIENKFLSSKKGR